MARDVREAVKKLHPRLLGGFDDLEKAIQAARLGVVTQYRVWIAVRFLVKAQGHSEMVAAFRQSAQRLMDSRRRKQIVRAVERLRRAMEDPPSDAPYVPIPAIAFGWPPELRQLANYFVQLDDLEKILDQHVESAEVCLICQEQPGDRCAGRDPVAHVAIRALDRVLELDRTRPTARERRRLIKRILDGVLPSGYRSDEHPFGPQNPQKKWSDSAIRQHVETPTAMEEIVNGPA
jgi:hypothetical protein